MTKLSVMPTIMNKNNIRMYVGSSRTFQNIGWIHPCYFCETPCGNFENFCGVEVYVCKECKYMSIRKDGRVHMNSLIKNGISSPINNHVKTPSMNCDEYTYMSVRKDIVVPKNLGIENVTSSPINTIIKTPSGYCMII